MLFETGVICLVDEIFWNAIKIGGRSVALVREVQSMRKIIAMLGPVYFTK
jgi:hypothetical protein